MKQTARTGNHSNRSSHEAHNHLQTYRKSGFEKATPSANPNSKRVITTKVGKAIIYRDKGLSVYNKSMAGQQKDVRRQTSRGNSKVRNGTQSVVYSIQTDNQEDMFSVKTKLSSRRKLDPFLNSRPPQDLTTISFDKGPNDEFLEVRSINLVGEQY